jgi:hypothetical protein
MSKFYCVAVAAFLLASTQGVFAATAAQTGTYIGTLKTKVRTVSGVTSVKSAMQVEIALDNTTTVTLNNIPQTAGTALYGTNECIIAFADPTIPASVIEISLATGKFKNSTLSGATSSLTFDGALSADTLTKTSSGKFKLKKQ